MAMIKDATARRMARDAVVLDLGDLQRQAERLKQRAQEEAERIIAEARAERERLLAGAAEEGRSAGREQGLEEGRAEGREQGRAEAREQASSRIEEIASGWARALDDFLRRREDILIDARSDVLRLALLFAQKVTKRSVECDPSVIEAQLEETIGQTLQPTSLRVVVNPEDRETAQEILPELVARLAGGAPAELVDDERIGRGGCVVRTAGGEIDASIETQVERIVARLLPSHERVDESARESPPEDVSE